ncbi:hypothetical protein [Thermocoleostomius sinensis]|uniref:Uncharacterized protein n=1 Tax=Thermocoleostomius sinensis A174 TaxID=2016057 RepID=A0A9E9C7T8_9CYAN|nr:hypothetical protein [Thermocoleostomius sinensis]WAL59583.1 hypothetical protein OXH18_20800 [Thermocoleostomius sinensis A174]
MVRIDRFWGVVGISLSMAIASRSLEAFAQPAEVFLPHLQHIQEKMPPHQVMRLPREILLSGSGDLHPRDLIVKIFSSQSPPRLTIGLFTCESGPFPCLVGTLAAEAATSATAQRELARHQAMHLPITLAKDVRGYLQEGPNLQPLSDFSSVMWEQDGTIYTVRFLATERQNILFMARSMAIQPPIMSLQIASP